MEKVSFESDGLTLSGTLNLPPDYKPGEKRPAIIVLHGFGSNKSSGNVVGPCAMLSKRGYVTLGFDMRGCGESEGKRANLICLEQVRDTSSAVTFLQSRPEVDSGRIGLLGSSFGAAVAVYTGSVDERVGAVISSGGWGNGERKFRGQHPGAAWDKFMNMLAQGKRHREQTGESLMVPRYDIVPIPPELRGHLAAGAILEFTAETAQSMFDFRADDVVHRMAPRPLLLLHSSVDTVTPTEQSIEMFKRAGQPCDLHLFAETDHFMFADSNVRVHSVVFDWLERYFPVRVAEAAAA
ncbi:MAG: alpha/beta hydrolase [Rhizobiales bacterium 62-17]|nr:alpha/beta fold hydrolase [Hyphomicrobiales bacterium]OJY05177.1 MAG: alpha/beta hydrolase [Rhizobiales bacterium 62-17]